MAITYQNSTQYANIVADPPVIQDVNELSGKVRVAQVTFNQTGEGAIGSEIELTKLPAGKILVLGALTRLENSAYGTSCALDLGFRAYTNESGTAVTEDKDYFASALAVVTAGTLAMNEELTAGVAELNSLTGITVYGTISGAVIPDKATLKGYITYIQY